MQQFYFLEPSKILAIILIFIHFGAIGCVFVSKLGLSFDFYLAFLILFSLIYSVFKYCFFYGCSSVRQFGFAGNHWILKDGCNSITKAQLIGKCFITRWMTVVFFKSETRMYPVVIFCDSLNNDVFRKLIVELKCF